MPPPGAPVSLKLRSSRCPAANATSRVIEPLSEWMNANGRLRVTWRHISPMTPPCSTAAPTLAGPERGEHRVEPPADALREAVHRLPARDQVPALLHQRAHGDRVALGEPDPVLAALPLAEVDLAEVLDHRRLEAGGGRQRRRRLRGPLERRDEQRPQRLAAQARRHRLRLRLARGRQRRVAVPADQRERLPALQGGRRAVPHQRPARPRRPGRRTAAGDSSRSRQRTLEPMHAP